VNRRLDKSLELWHRACAVIPGGTQTLSKGADQFVQGVAPRFLTRGRDAHVWDVDGNEYIDYMMALGPVVLGYADPRVNEAVVAQLQNGMQFSLPHPIEVELAEELCALIPCAEMVRFGKNGSDATAGAIRVARAFTGRDLVAVAGYHGWQDWYIGSTRRNRGVPESTRRMTLSFKYNDIAALRSLLDDNAGRIAAVILEPIHAESPKPGFLEAVSELAHQHGTLVVWDEVKTGFRFGLGGAQEHYGVTPDLACFGKAMANGMPISALVGRRDVMSVMPEVFFSFTAGGETLSIAAALATIRVLRESDALTRIWTMGEQLCHGYNGAAAAAGLTETTSCDGLAPMTVVSFRDETGAESSLIRSLFQQEMLDRSILFDDGFVLCAAHTPEDIEATLRAVRESMNVVAEAIRSGGVRSKIRGTPIAPLFG